MKTYTNFYFEKYTFNSDTLEAVFYYNYDGKLFFEEKINFFDANFVIRQSLDLEVIENILFHIHIALGISYYKFYLSPNLVFKTGKLDEYGISFWKKFYLNGLGEFFYRNNINPNGLLNFKFETQKKYKKKSFEIKEKYLVPVGGGKDSIVSIELLKKMKKKIDLVTFAVNDNELYENTAKIAGLKRLFIKRELSTNIMQVINEGVYNGHVPITGIIAFVLELTCYLYDYKYIVLSNEASANFGNTLWKGLNINHQWSKSLEFEKDFSKYIKKYISSDIKYFSLLRPFYELQIAQIFAKLGKKYFTKFSSCNTNFKIFKKSPSLTDIPLNKGELKGDFSYWCNNCPKCVFVYIILRPFLTKKEILNMFGYELYEDDKLDKIFLELAGISGIKPFECVGTNDEVVLAILLTLKKWKGKLPFILDILKKEINGKIKDKDLEKLKKKILIPDFEKNIIPKEILQELKNIFNI